MSGHDYTDMVRTEHTRRIDSANRDGWWLQPKRTPRTPRRVTLTKIIVAFTTKIS